MNPFRSIARPLRRLTRARDGIAATEFALIAPILLSLYFGVTELTDGLICDTKVTRMASTAADLVAQDNQITNAEMADVMTALNSIMFPYPAASTQIRISSLIDAGNGQVKVAWSDAQNTTPRAVDSFVTVPQGLVSSGGSIIFAEIKHFYTSPAGELIYGTIELNDQFYVRPRRVLQVARVP